VGEKGRGPDSADRFPTRWEPPLPSCGPSGPPGPSLQPCSRIHQSVLLLGVGGGGGRHATA
ncbi:hypothetical protein P7K49_011574, partial [Saguinus oedipus]